MHSRKNPEAKSTNFPQDWLDEAIGIFEEVYGEQCAQYDKAFRVFGSLYPDEISLAVSIVSMNNIAMTPATYICSCDLKEGQNPKKVLKQMVDSTEFFLEDYFRAPNDFENYQHDWDKTKIKNFEFHYKVSRENIDLTLEADRLLNSDF